MAILGIKSVNNKKILELSANPTLDGTGLLNIEQGSIAIFGGNIYVKQSLKGVAPATDWTQLATGGAAWALTGNSIAGGETIGTNNAFNFDMKANGSVLMSLLSGGDIQIKDGVNLEPEVAGTSSLGGLSTPFLFVATREIYSGDSPLALTTANSNAMSLSSAGNITLVADSEGVSSSYVFGATGFNMGAKAITNVLDPVNAQDGATKNYVDALVNPLLNSVRFREFAKVLTDDDLNAVVNGTLLSAVLPFSDDDGTTITISDFADGDYFISNASDGVNGATLWRVFLDGSDLKITTVGVTQPVDAYAYHVKFNLQNSPDALEKRAIFVAEDNGGIVTMIKVADETFAGGTGIELLANTPINTLGGVVSGSNPIATTDSITEAIQKLIYDVDALGTPAPKWSIGGDNFGISTSEDFGSTTNTNIRVIRNGFEVMLFGSALIDVSTAFRPKSANTYDLGGPANFWKDAYANSFRVGTTGDGVVGRISNTGTTFQIRNLQDTGLLDLNTVNVTAPATNSGAINIASGNSTLADSGNITIQTGTAPSGTRGQIILNGSSIDASSSQIKNVADPTVAQDAVTLSYLENNAWILGGNALGAGQSIGSTNNFDVSIIRNNATRMEFLGANTNLSTGENGLFNVSVGDFANVSASLETISFAYRDASVTDEGNNVVGMYYEAINKTLQIGTFPNTTVSGQTSSVSIVSGSNENASNAGATGEIDIGTGNHLGTGASGRVRITTGETASGPAGDIYLQTGTPDVNASTVNTKGRVYLRAQRVRFQDNFESLVANIGISTEEHILRMIPNLIPTGSLNAQKLTIQGTDTDASVPTNTSAGDLTIRAGNSVGTLGTSNGGNVRIESGSSDNDDAGEILIKTASGGVNGADIIIETSNLTSGGIAGNIVVQAGENSGGDRGEFHINETLIAHRFTDAQDGIVERTMGYAEGLTDPLGNSIDSFFTQTQADNNKSYTMKTGDSTTGSTGSLYVISGDSSGGNGDSGDIVLFTGNPNGTGVRGNIIALADSFVFSADGTAQAILSDTGSSFAWSTLDVVGANNARNIALVAGDSVNGSAGSLDLDAGISTGTGDGGAIALKADLHLKNFREGGVDKMLETELIGSASNTDGQTTTILSDTQLTDGNLYVYRVTYTAIDASNNTNVFIRTVHVKRFSGTATVVFEQTDFTSEENINTDVQAQASGGNIIFQVINNTGGTVNWLAKVEKMEFDV